MKFSIEDNKINVLMKREDIIEGKIANLLVLIEVLYKSCKNVLPYARAKPQTCWIKIIPRPKAEYFFLMNSASCL